ncbi:acetamidase/formamidase family protein [Desulfonatronovibrio hydrogenovorans]|uniref:acetamidase/formamidase family protein n=1 Tax=Desulfonatronovibrio hydrogenovorans TaxID=53245 RepID=UPI00049100FB|nr:acetamidase/formamidase family protein [Desulfonatronovibrio hydrogenovorans]
MIPTLDGKNVFHAFSPKLEPAMSVAQGQEFLLKTLDCFGGQIKSERDLLESLDWENVNPATGPVYIEGVRPGEIIGFDILDIKINDHSIAVVAPGEGVPGKEITTMETALLTHENNVLNFKDIARINIKPMIGVMGVAPKDRDIPNGTPEKHGGNMDCRIITAGSRIYFKAEVEGALFGCGDLHSAQGDGEIGVSGAETSGEVLLKAEVFPDLQGLPTPFLENDHLVATIFSAETADQAAKGAVDSMVEFLTGFAGLEKNHAVMLMSIAGDLRFCQMVDPLKTVRFEFPKKILSGVSGFHAK